MKQKSLVTISRYWNNPKITTEIWLEGIQITKDLNDFKSSLKIEIKNEILDFANNILKKNLIGRIIDKVLGKKIILEEEKLFKIFDEAFDGIINKIKEESAKVV